MHQTCTQLLISVRLGVLRSRSARLLGEEVVLAREQKLPQLLGASWAVASSL